MNYRLHTLTVTLSWMGVALIPVYRRETHNEIYATVEGILAVTMYQVPGIRCLLAGRAPLRYLQSRGGSLAAPRPRVCAVDSNL